MIASSLMLFKQRTSEIVRFLPEPGRPEEPDKTIAGPARWHGIVEFHGAVKTPSFDAALLVGPDGDEWPVVFTRREVFDEMMRVEFRLPGPPSANLVRLVRSGDWPQRVFFRPDE